jgi:hypothetical protein
MRAFRGGCELTGMLRSPGDETIRSNEHGAFRADAIGLAESVARVGQAVFSDAVVKGIWAAVFNPGLSSGTRQQDETGAEQIERREPSAVAVEPDVWCTCTGAAF